MRMVLIIIVQNYRLELTILIWFNLVREDKGMSPYLCNQQWRREFGNVAYVALFGGREMDESFTDYIDIVIDKQRSSKPQK